MNRGRICYRVEQFFQTLWTTFSPVDRDYVANRLSPSLLVLFETMSRSEQHHGIMLCKGLEEQGSISPDLRVAALLHDVGKTLAPPYLWERVWVVLAEHYTPRLASHLSYGTPRGLRRGFVTRRMHPLWGAELVEEAGASPRAVTLIRRHHDAQGDDVDLARLQALDDQI